MRKTRLLLASLLFLASASLNTNSLAQTGTADWHAALQKQLPLLGHRNWILIVDSAYPLQVSLGIETIETNATQLEVTRAVLEALDHTIHVTPNVFLDAELPYVPAKDFAEVNSYRDSLKTTLAGHSVKSLPHEELLKKIGEAGKTFKVLVLKTNMAIPYTSVFLQLDCRYWGEESEQKLRQAMKSSIKK
jgi:hypothetical protein